MWLTIEYKITCDVVPRNHSVNILLHKGVIFRYFDRTPNDYIEFVIETPLYKGLIYFLSENISKINNCRLNLMANTEYIVIRMGMSPPPPPSSGKSRGTCHHHTVPGYIFVFSLCMN